MGKRRPLLAAVDLFFMKLQIYKCKPTVVSWKCSSLKCCSFSPSFFNFTSVLESFPLFLTFLRPWVACCANWSSSTLRPLAANRQTELGAGRAASLPAWCRHHWFILVTVKRMWSIKDLWAPMDSDVSCPLACSSSWVACCFRKGLIT